MIFGKNKSDMWLIAGLGNPGLQYEKTRHNAGFMAADRLAEKHGAQFNKHKSEAVYADFKIGDNRILLVKPQTYMNNSGEAVGALAKFYKIPAERVIIIADDISLDVGRMRIRRKGSDGGHNGLKSIALHIGDGYPRIKIGVGKKPRPDYDLAAWVLSKFTEQERGALDTAVQNACKAVQLMVSGETDKAMNLYNS